jgi:hypothetical protein
VTCQGQREGQFIQSLQPSLQGHQVVALSAPHNVLQLWVTMDLSAAWSWRKKSSSECCALTRDPDILTPRTAFQVARCSPELIQYLAQRHRAGSHSSPCFAHCLGTTHQLVPGLCPLRKVITQCQARISFVDKQKEPKHTKRQSWKLGSLQGQIASGSYSIPSQTKKKGLQEQVLLPHPAGDALTSTTPAI